MIQVAERFLVPGDKQMRHQVEIDDGAPHPRLPCREIARIVEDALRWIKRLAEPVSDNAVALLD